MLLSTDRSPRTYWLAALLAAWAALLFGGFALGTADSPGGERIPTPARMGSSFVLVVAAWSWYFCVRPNTLSLSALLVAVGMTFGFAGDLFMAGLIPAGERTLGGMGSFGCGHVAYLAAFLYLASRLRLPWTGPRLAAWAAWLLVGVAGWYLIVYRTDHPAALRRAALGYVLLLASTAGCATGLALAAPGFWSLACGASLFFLSDLILAAEMFSGYRAGSAVWLTYGPGQMLIVYSTGAYLARGETRPSEG